MHKGPVVRLLLAAQMDSMHGCLNPPCLRANNMEVGAFPNSLRTNLSWGFCHTHVAEVYSRGCWLKSSSEIRKTLPCAISVYHNC
jgi:hypothetical protein